jgi:hypothetical protein
MLRRHSAQHSPDSRTDARRTTQPDVADVARQRPPLLRSAGCTPGPKGAESIAPARWKVAWAGCGLAIGHNRGATGSPRKRALDLRVDGGRLLDRATAGTVHSPARPLARLLPHVCPGLIPVVASGYSCPACSWRLVRQHRHVGAASAYDLTVRVPLRGDPSGQPQRLVARAACALRRVSMGARDAWLHTSREWPTCCRDFGTRPQHRDRRSARCFIRTRLRAPQPSSPVVW